LAHLQNMPPRTRANVEKLDCPVFETTPFVAGPALNQRRVAVVSSAGIHARDDKTFALSSSDFRKMSATDDILMSHVSVNYDRTGFVQDINTVLPVDRLAELADDGVIGSVAQSHYSFMGATDPTEMAPYAAQVAGMLKADQVDAVLLVPV
jgi:D-proline reductase (dithiol) PrdB